MPLGIHWVQNHRRLLFPSLRTQSLIHRVLDEYSLRAVWPWHRSGQLRDSNKDIHCRSWVPVSHQGPCSSSPHRQLRICRMTRGISTNSAVPSESRPLWIHHLSSYSYSRGAAGYKRGRKSPSLLGSSYTDDVPRPTQSTLTTFNRDSAVSNPNQAPRFL